MDRIGVRCAADSDDGFSKTDGSGFGNIQATEVTETMPTTDEHRLTRIYWMRKERICATFQEVDGKQPSVMSNRAFRIAKSFRAAHCWTSQTVAPEFLAWTLH